MSSALRKNCRRREWNHAGHLDFLSHNSPSLHHLSFGLCTQRDALCFPLSSPEWQLGRGSLKEHSSKMLFFSVICKGSIKFTACPPPPNPPSLWVLLDVLDLGNFIHSYHFLYTHLHCHWGFLKVSECTLIVTSVMSCCFTDSQWLNRKTRTSLGKLCVLYVCFSSESFWICKQAAVSRFSPLVILF